MGPWQQPTRTVSRETNFDGDANLRALRQLFHIHSFFPILFCQIDGLGAESKREMLQRFDGVCRHCDCIETHEYDVAGAHILAYFPLSHIPLLVIVFISSIDARAR